MLYDMDEAPWLWCWETVWESLSWLWIAAELDGSYILLTMVVGRAG